MITILVQHTLHARTRNTHTHTHTHNHTHTHTRARARITFSVSPWCSCWCHGQCVGTQPWSVCLDTAMVIVSGHSHGQCVGTQPWSVCRDTDTISVLGHCGWSVFWVVVVGQCFGSDALYVVCQKFAQCWPTMSRKMVECFLFLRLPPPGHRWCDVPWR